MIERAQQLSMLRDAMAAVHQTSIGALVLIGGEAGVGKSALVRSFARGLTGTRVLVGACDATSTPRPLGPFLDVAEAAGGELERRADGGARPHELASELLRELRTRQRTLLVVEDLHWADAATLDVVRLIARRVQGVPALVVGTYRDDELDGMHPMRTVLGELATYEGVSRLRLVPLSARGVSELADPLGVDGAELYARTGGNPFFVTEVLASDGAIPQTVQDAVHARVSRLSARARRLIEALATMPQGAEIRLLESLAPEVVGGLDECLTSGVFTSTPGGVSFRHEIARLAVEATIPPHRRLALHARILNSLRVSGAADAARLAHHAEGAGDAPAVLEFAPAAAARAAAVGAHREAASQLARALRFGDGLSTERRAELLSLKSSECFLTGDYDAAISARRQAIEIYRQMGDSLREGDALCTLSSTLRCHGLVREADAAGQASLELLRSLPPGPELAKAYAQQAMLALNAEALVDAVRWGNLAIGLAERAGDRETTVHAMNSVGSAGYLQGREEGRLLLERSLAMSREWDMSEQAGRAYINLAWASTRNRDYAREEEYQREGLENCLERRPERLPRQVTARRGDPDHKAPLEEARSIAAPTGELQHLAPVATAEAEIAWMSNGPGTRDSVRDATQRALDLATGAAAPWLVGELACWRRRAGVRESAVGEAAGPYAAELRGDIVEASGGWLALGCAYEAALVGCCGNDLTDLRRALDEFQRLGARVPAGIAARHLRERGARGLPRGPRPSTRQNQANLTKRELEILGLVARGLRNREMAKALFISEKTVDHHVSAVLRKLGLHNRAEATAEAQRLGIGSQDG